jgi:hypothetical protein
MVNGRLSFAVSPDTDFGALIGSLPARAIGQFVLGYQDTGRAHERAPWQDKVDPLEGVTVHEPERAAGAE